MFGLFECFGDDDRDRLAVPMYVGVLHDGQIAGGHPLLEVRQIDKGGAFILGMFL